MDNFSDRFRAWMDERRLKASDIAAALHIEEQTVRNWRASGVPPRRESQISQYMADFDKAAAGDPIDVLRMRTLVVEATREELIAWQRAALASGKILDDWARDGLNEMAKARGYGDLVNPIVFPKAAEDVVEYKAGGEPLRATPPSGETLPTAKEIGENVARKSIDAIVRNAGAVKAAKLKQVSDPAPQDGITIRAGEKHITPPAETGNGSKA